MMTRSSRLALVVFAHGSRDPEWRRPFDRLVDTLRSEGVADPVRLAFLQFEEPTLEAAVDEAVEAGAGRVRVWPLFVAPGAHVKRDLPERIAKVRRRHPDVEIDAADPVGDDPRLFETLVAIGRDVGRDRV